MKKLNNNNIWKKIYSEKNIIVLLVFFIIFTIIILIVQSKKIDNFSNTLSSIKLLTTIDSIQSENLKIMDSLKKEQIYLNKKLDSFKLIDKEYFNKIITEQNRFKKYEEKYIKENIYPISNYSSNDLKREYSKFEE